MRTEEVNIYQARYEGEVVHPLWHLSMEFPDSLSPQQCKVLEAILPSKPSRHMTDMELDECEETMLHDVNIKEETRRKQQQQAHEAYDEDEDMHGGA
ncbi:hypothetical protein E3N88_03049 [Mikania micrantha]|uniref:Uncharacterized protein n=1 Tax=Mikania micrantha TaxID=192012 RepID=A0A5N6Q5W9_9ASTR|nr:hypothetical protein E3N88_03049 [Mikania micrantha]